MRKIHLAISVAVIALAASCSPNTYQNINYMQDIARDTTMTLNAGEGIIVQPQDMISIVVSCREPQLAAMFNLTNVSYQAGSQASINGGYQRLMGYTVDTDGNI
nr:polysaccharide export protein [Bacteroidales bacterium]